MANNNNTPQWNGVQFQQTNLQSPWEGAFKMVSQFADSLKSYGDFTIKQDDIQQKKIGNMIQNQLVGIKDDEQFQKLANQYATNPYINLADVIKQRSDAKKAQLDAKTAEVNLASEKQKMRFEEQLQPFKIKEYQANIASTNARTAYTRLQYKQSLQKARADEVTNQAFSEFYDAYKKGANDSELGAIIDKWGKVPGADLKTIVTTVEDMKSKVMEQKLKESQLNYNLKELQYKEEELGYKKQKTQGELNKLNSEARYNNAQAIKVELQNEKTEKDNKQAEAKQKAEIDIAYNATGTYGNTSVQDKQHTYTVASDPTKAYSTVVKGLGESNSIPPSVKATVQSLSSNIQNNINNRVDGYATDAQQAIGIAVGKALARIANDPITEQEALNIINDINKYGTSLPEDIKTAVQQIKNNLEDRQMTIATKFFDKAQIVPSSTQETLHLLNGLETLPIAQRRVLTNPSNKAILDDPDSGMKIQYGSAIIDVDGKIHYTASKEQIDNSIKVLKKLNPMQVKSAKGHFNVTNDESVVNGFINNPTLLKNIQQDMINGKNELTPYLASLVSTAINQYNALSLKKNQPDNVIPQLPLSFTSNHTDQVKFDQSTENTLPESSNTTPNHTTNTNTPPVDPNVPNNDSQAPSDPNSDPTADIPTHKITKKNNKNVVEPNTPTPEETPKKNATKDTGPTKQSSSLTLGNDNNVTYTKKTEFNDPKSPISNGSYFEYQSTPNGKATKVGINSVAETPSYKDFITFTDGSKYSLKDISDVIRSEGDGDLSYVDPKLRAFIGTLDSKTRTSILNLNTSMSSLSPLARAISGEDIASPKNLSSFQSDWTTIKDNLKNNALNRYEQNKTLGPIQNALNPAIIAQGKGLGLVLKNPNLTKITVSYTDKAFNTTNRVFDLLNPPTDPKEKASFDENLEKSTNYVLKSIGQKNNLTPEQLNNLNLNVSQLVNEQLTNTEPDNRKVIEMASGHAVDKNYASTGIQDLDPTPLLTDGDPSVINNLDFSSDVDPTGTLKNYTSKGYNNPNDISMAKAIGVGSAMIGNISDRAKADRVSTKHWYGTRRDPEDTSATAGDVPAIPLNNATNTKMSKIASQAGVMKGLKREAFSVMYPDQDMTGMSNEDIDNILRNLAPKDDRWTTLKEETGLGIKVTKDGLMLIPTGDATTRASWLANSPTIKTAVDIYYKAHTGQGKQNLADIVTTSAQQNRDYAINKYFHQHPKEVKYMMLQVITRFPPKEQKTLISMFSSSLEGRVVDFHGGDGTTYFSNETLQLRRKFINIVSIYLLNKYKEHK